MYSFGKSSKAKLETVNNVLASLMEEAILTSPIDFGITYGHRSAEEQYKLFLAGKSKNDGVKVKSKHQEGIAVDIAVYVNGKITWDAKYYYLVAGHILGTANSLEIKLRWGGDWDRDTDLDDQTFNDLCHFELVF